MREVLLLISIVFICGSTIAQTAKEDYSKILNIELGKDFEGKTVTIDAEFFGFGMANMRKPNKFKVGYMPFRCKEIDGEPLKNGFGGETGDFFFIKKKNESANVVKNLKKGDKVTITGEVYINNNLGYKQANFIVYEIIKF
ncbi:hypothetical protein [Carboxylicivirga marina]|uniref:hypothetical protein n=1 Tax=Carboxylicivirga marina TaxID=2800988 RepID=UPI0025950839|nr:hypothetical protein [uncultured Carboxylicivirga sp.]